jgi:hypothetical protein
MSKLCLLGLFAGLLLSSSGCCWWADKWCPQSHYTAPAYSTYPACPQQCCPPPPPPCQPCTATAAPGPSGYPACAPAAAPQCGCPVPH